MKICTFIIILTLTQITSAQKIIPENAKEITFCTALLSANDDDFYMGFTKEEWEFFEEYLVND